MFYLNFYRDLDANFVQKYQKCQICAIYGNLEWKHLHLFK